MFQSAITCREYDEFVKVAKESEEKAIQLLVKYTNTTQETLQEVVDYLYHGGMEPQLQAFSSSECELQRKIASGEMKKVFEEGSRITGNHTK